MSTNPNAKPLKTKTTYLVKVISVKYVEVSPYTYNKLNDDDRRYNGYKSKWIDEVVKNPTIKSSEESLCFANECGDHIDNMYWYDSATDEQKAWQKKQNKKQYEMVMENGYYDCSCFRV